MRTPAMDSVFTALRRLLLNRRRQAGARRGLIIPGPATTGKTTTMMALGRSFQPADARRHPGQDGRRPVLFISVPPAATPKMLVSAFARFLGMPLTDRLNQTQITSAVCDTVCELGTQLVLIDDVHLLDTQRRAGAETSDQLKHLGETHPGHLRVLRDSTSRPPHCSAGCAERRSPADSRSSATAHWRMPPSRTERSGTTSYKAMEDLLRLRAHRPGALVKHAAYLHARTAGRIGSLSHLIREAALVAIVEGAERITKQLLSEAELDAAAEAQARPARPRTTAAEASGVTQQLSTTATRRTPASGRTGGKPAASCGIVPAMGCGAAGRVAPLPGELTLSFLTRLAARHHLTIRGLLAAVTDVGGQQNLTGVLYPDSEIHLNAQARVRVATLCRVPPRVLEQALPAWRREEPCGKYGAGPAGRLMRGEEAVAAWGPACPA
ncbi:hypothetical protein GCM10018789_64900 [Streptomyces werraensis]|nr:hypothetical protein GCM10018789_64900 [Streptomyces werraensis]